LVDLVDDNETGVLVPAGDVAALGSAMARVAGDADMRTSMGDAGAVKVRAFTVSAVVERLESAYERAIENSRRAA
jgi:glycosyltransferase involved in cell wall biosynthesis